MKRDEKPVEEVLQRSLPSAPRAQMEAALDRVFTRLQSDRGETVPREGGLVPPRRPRAGGWWRPAITATAAVLVAAIVFIMAWRHRDVYAVLELADGSMSRIVDGHSVPVHVQEQIGAEQIVRSNGGAVIAMADGSRVEMRSQSELSLERADDGVRIRLRTGGIIVNAAKQGGGHLYVQTKDMTVTVVGTVFVVNAEEDGSRVTVIEGEVRVHEGKIETRLRPGEQVSTSRALAARPLREEIAWSRHSDAYRVILAAFAKGMADTAGPLAPLSKATGSAKAAADQTASAASAASAQATAPKQEFEEASIRPCDPNNLPPTPAGARGGGANSFQMTPGRTHVLCMTLATIVRHAYGYGPADLEFLNPGGRGRGMNVNIVYGLGVEDGVRVRGGPDWVRNERYTIDAVADGAADGATMSGPMLRALLERRFQLKVHIESEQVQAFTLTAAKTGLKLKAVEPGACDPVPVKPGQPITPGMVPPRTAADVRRGVKPYCGLRGSRNGPNQVWVGGEVTLEAVARALGAPLGGVQVFDKTGNTEKFNLILEYAMDENTPGTAKFFTLPDPGASADVPRGQTIFTALEEQLGVRLEPARAPREFIVIDRVERPSPN